MTTCCDGRGASWRVSDLGRHPRMTVLQLMRARSGMRENLCDIQVKMARRP
jgi:hypothetical protein